MGSGSTHEIVMLDTRQAAEFLHLEASTLERWRTKGDGPIFLKVGGRVLYTLEALQTYIAERQRRSTAEHRAKVQESWRRELAEARLARKQRFSKRRKGEPVGALPLEFEGT